MQKCGYILILLMLAITSAKAQFIFDKPLGTDGFDISRELLITQDGNYLVMGYSKNSTIGNNGLYLTKVDTTGTILWEKWYYTIGSSGNYSATSICETVDGDFVVGSQVYNGIDFSGLLIKFNAQGDTLYSKSDSIDYGKDVYQLIQAPDSNLLVIIYTSYGWSLVKLDNNLNPITRIDSISGYKNIEVIQNKICIIRNDSVNNLIIIDKHLQVLDSVNVPIKYPSFLRKNYNETEMVIYGRDSSYWQTPHKMIHIDLQGNILQICDSINNQYDDGIYDFKPINSNNKWLFAYIDYTIQYGYDIKLNFTDSCANINFDTIFTAEAFQGN